jgi:hypothetical protein
LWSDNVEQVEVITKSNADTILSRLRPRGGGTAVNNVYRWLTNPAKIKKKGQYFIAMDPTKSNKPMGIVAGIIYVTDLQFNEGVKNAQFLKIPTVFFGPKFSGVYSGCRPADIKEMNKRGYLVHTYDPKERQA